MAQPPWWRGAVIYEIYPRSFSDSNADGIGDLQGIIDRLDYVASLGVDAIWIAPFFKSPMADFGYDVADYRSVDPMFGSMDDFDRLLARAHSLGLRVIIDQVLSHTSSEHAWFKESRSSRDNPKADWYVWAEPRADGTPPNNWLSIFGGVAWRWEPRRRQYYLHNFLSSQPDLNFHNPEVRRASLDNLRFWLDKGVDGLRLDAINFCFHDPLLRDNPPKPAEQRISRAFSPENPYAYQYHHYNNTQPENLEFLVELRALLEEYPDVAALGEVSSEDSLATMAEYTSANRLHMAYSFELLSDDSSAAHLHTTVATLESRMKGGWPCWALSNHDVRRVVTRWGGQQPSPALANQLLAMLCSLRGSVCIYQGEELGLPDAELPFSALRDPYGIAFWPIFKGRDGCRTPMPWDETQYGGFSAVAPWLPLAEEHRSLSVTQQHADRHSTLNAFRAFMRWRRAFPALLWGDVRIIPVADTVFAFERSYRDSQIVAAFNLGSDPVDTTLQELRGWRQVETVGLLEGTLANGRLRLPACGAVFAKPHR
ncbi:MAG TPA: alpha-glucosidase [Povalibacter sp.]